MVTTAAYYANARYRTAPGDPFDGVVRIDYGGYYGTGSLLFDGRALLTAAHLFEGHTGSVNVTVETPWGTQTLEVGDFVTHPGYDVQSNNDLAIVWLNAAAPVPVNRYDIYRSNDEIGQTFSLAGYGRMGTGATGATINNSTHSVLLKASNQFDADAATLKTYLPFGMAWSPLAGTQLIADFDNGRYATDALGQLIYRDGLGLGLDEGLVASGDSGGPAFINNQVAGVASYTASLSNGSLQPDIDGTSNSSFGEIASWQRVSAYQQWIDQSLRAHYPAAPTRPSEVKKEVPEGNSGLGYVYFLLQFTGLRTDPNQVLSVDYSTRDGTATAGSDYLALAGKLNLYPGENQAVMAVEIIGDATPEANETFYLDVFNPVGASFEAGAVRLTAVRTIIDDDGFFG